MFSSPSPSPLPAWTAVTYYPPATCTPNANVAMKSRPAAPRRSPVKVGNSDHSHYVFYLLLILGSSLVKNTNGIATVTCNGVPLCSNLKCRWVGQSYDENHITINGNYTHDKSVTVKCH